MDPASSAQALAVRDVVLALEALASSGRDAVVPSEGHDAAPVREVLDQASGALAAQTYPPFAGGPVALVDPGWVDPVIHPLNILQSLVDVGQETVDAHLLTCWPSVRRAAPAVAEAAVAWASTAEKAGAEEAGPVEMREVEDLQVGGPCYPLPGS